MRNNKEKFNRKINTKEDKRLIKFMSKLITKYSETSDLSVESSQRNMKIHKARKEHKCSVCGGKIPAGDRYWREHDEDEYNSGLGGDKEHTNCELY